MKGQIDNPLSLNLYTYVGNNPLIYNDPTGQSWKSVWNWTKKAASTAMNLADDIAMSNPYSAGAEITVVKGVEYAWIGSKWVKVAVFGTKSATIALKYAPTSGAALVSTAGKTTTILGKYSDDIQYVIKELNLKKSLDFTGNKGGFNILNVPDNLYKTAEQFWKDYNKPFLDQAIARGDEIIMATKPTLDKLYIPGTKDFTGFGREYYYLLDKGYKFISDLNKMVKN